jgi:hypothetical protein
MEKKVYDKTYNEDKKQTVKRYLEGNCVGVGNSIHYKDSRGLFGLHQRQLGHIINELRNEGNPICSHNTHGIWWAGTKEELQGTVSFLSSRISVMSANVEGLKKALESFK